MRDAWSLGLSALPLVTTAIHAGHDLRPEIAEKVALDDLTRRREEDPFTDRITEAGGWPVVVHRSRFEVDLNRPRHRCVYQDAESAWGLDVWREPLSDEQVERSRRMHDAFYGQLQGILDDLARQGPFVVLDVHSYNHRRDGADRPPAPAKENPEINIGTGSMDRDRWGHVVDRFMHDLGDQVVAGHRLEVGENVRFKGGHLCEWVHERYADTGCAIAVELKKVFMDEWTGTVDEQHLEELTAAFAAAVPLLLGELACGAA
ncbi:MAG: N-formylglutamate amidohydrolase [Acidimicrobiales bacterium]